MQSQWGLETAVEFVDAIGDTHLLVIGPIGLDLYVNGRQTASDLQQVGLSADDHRTLILSAGAPSRVTLRIEVNGGDEEVILRVLALGKKIHEFNRERQVPSISFADPDGDHHILCFNRNGLVDLYVCGQRRASDLISARKRNGRVVLRSASLKETMINVLEDDAMKRVDQFFGGLEDSSCSSAVAAWHEASPNLSSSDLSTAATEPVPLQVLQERLMARSGSGCRRNSRATASYPPPFGFEADDSSSTSSLDDECQDGRVSVASGSHTSSLDRELLSLGGPHQDLSLLVGGHSRPGSLLGSSLVPVSTVFRTRPPPRELARLQEEESLFEALPPRPSCR